MKQMNKLALDRLPDEILIEILSQPILPLSTLQVMQNVSNRMHLLCNYVLRHKRLPAIYLDVSMDQEGKSRVTSVFQLHQLSSDNANLHFKPLRPHVSKRYYTDKAAPVIRLVRMTDTYMQIKATSTHQPSYGSSDFLNEKLQSKEADHVKKKKRRTKGVELNAQRNGIYNVKKSTGFLFFKKPCFNLNYEISRRQQNEYYASALGISVSSDYLIKQVLDDSHKHPTKSKLCRITDFIKRCF